MKVEVVRNSGDLRREVWTFSIDMGYGSSYIYFDYYSFQSRDTKRHKWIPQTHWQRLDKRNNNTDPTLPTDVESEMRSKFQQQILKLVVVK